MKSKLSFFILLVLLLTGCNQTLATPSNLVTTSIATIEEKIANQETFVFYFSTGTCTYCLKYKNNAIRYLNTAPNHTLYRVDVNTMTSAKRNDFALVIYTLLGDSFYTANGYLANELYVPTTLKYINGVASIAEIGVLEQTEFASWFNE